MGVDFFPCGVCDEIIADCNVFYTCLKCKRYLCESCGPEADDKFGSVEDEYYGEGPTGCDACTGDIVQDPEIVEFLLRIFNLPREEIVASIIAERGEKIGNKDG